MGPLLFQYLAVDAYAFRARAFLTSFPRRSSRPLAALLQGPIALACTLAACYYTYMIHASQSDTAKMGNTKTQPWQGGAKFFFCVKLTPACRSRVLKALGVSTG